MVRLDILPTKLRPKWSVDYTSNANHSDEQCRKCKFYEGDYTCSKVMGHVLPGGWCKLFEDK